MLNLKGSSICKKRVSIYRTVPKKETLRPETGPEFPPNHKNIMQNSDRSEFVTCGWRFSLIHWRKQVLACIDREKLFCLFRDGKLFILPTVHNIIFTVTLHVTNTHRKQVSLGDEIIKHSMAIVST